jgi:N-acetylmuramidase/Putative peptidoglycan binding domain
MMPALRARRSASRPNKLFANKLFECETHHSADRAPEVLWRGSPIVTREATVPDDFRGNATPLSEKDLDDAAAALNCERAVIDAVCDVESAGGGFLPDGRPKILYEAHIFGRMTDGRWNRTNPNISAPAWDRSLYGAGGAHQYERLAEAIALDRDAALRSASWGRFQILGENCSAAGFANVEGFVRAMCDSEAAHLQAFLAFCRHARLVEAMQGRNWRSFALHYNGPGQVDFYAEALRKAFARHSAHAAAAPGDQVLHLLDRGPAVSKLQQLLKAAGSDVDVDGVFGNQTLDAVRAFQEKKHLVDDGVVGSLTWAALRAPA